MNCPKLDELLERLEGAVSVTRDRELAAHLEVCSQCGEHWRQLEAMTKRIGSSGRPFFEPPLVASIMQQIDEQPVAAHPVPWRRMAPWAFVLAAACVAAVVTIRLVPRLEAPEARYAARGAPQESPMRWSSVQVLRASPGSDEYAPLGATMASDEALVFRVHNGERSPYRYLAIFAVQSDGEIFWYYPDYTDPTDDPASIPIAATGNPQPLPDEIRHVLAPGELRIFCLFSTAPLRVLALEAAVQRALASALDIGLLASLDLAGVGEQSFLVRVGPASRR